MTGQRSLRRRTVVIQTETVSVAPGYRSLWFPQFGEKTSAKKQYFKKLRKIRYKIITF